MDGLAIRPALYTMADHLASLGYFVLLPDLFYRSGPYDPVDPRELFGNQALLKDWFAKHSSGVTNANFERDMRAFLGFLDSRKEAIARKVAVAGYCMGGRLALIAAGTFPDRIVAAASFHGGRLATDDADSPHLLAPRIKGEVYVAGAIDDQSFPDDMKTRLDAALTTAGVKHTVLTYEGARHGWVPTDTPVHNAEAAERHWQALRELLARTLGS
jgi:carboxymethylenebutenolidase